jgi:hypothetical protein
MVEKGVAGVRAPRQLGRAPGARARGECATRRLLRSRSAGRRAPKTGQGGFLYDLMDPQLAQRVSQTMYLMIEVERKYFHADLVTYKKPHGLIAFGFSFPPFHSDTISFETASHLHVMQQWVHSKRKRR